MLTIERDQFLAYPGSFGQNFYFPGSIQILDQNPMDSTKQSNTTLTFSNVEFVAEVKANTWKLQIPQDTKRTTIRGKFLPTFTPGT